MRYDFWVCVLECGRLARLQIQSGWDAHIPKLCRALQVYSGRAARIPQLASRPLKKLFVKTFDGFDFSVLVVFKFADFKAAEPCFSL